VATVQHRIEQFFSHFDCTLPGSFCQHGSLEQIVQTMAADCLYPLQQLTKCAFIKMLSWSAGLGSPNSCPCCKAPFQACVTMWYVAVYKLFFKSHSGCAILF
jgi:hypothetical protein